MELTFATIKALSSATRIKILDRLLDQEATPTALSDDLGKSKSTIASHLSILVDAGLVEKDEEEGRRRVLYHPTSKAKTIVKGRERKIKFSVASSIVSGILLLGTALTFIRQRAASQAEQTAQAAIGTLDAGGAAHEGANQAPLLPPEALGVGLVVLTCVLLFSLGSSYVFSQLDA
ncbi:MAG: winged helix-turn-helix domain-containing protein [Candidatus Nanohaloarchaea archaeon]|nr:winged helix-turn-helix domain-containing protein [Candidatus Nanohaloarchaea archaeon]